MPLKVSLELEYFTAGRNLRCHLGKSAFYREGSWIPELLRYEGKAPQVTSHQLWAVHTLSTDHTAALNEAMARHGTLNQNLEAFLN